MTMPNIIPSYSTTAPTIRREIGIFLVRLGRLTNRWIAVAIARHERKAALWALMPAQRWGTEGHGPQPR